MTVGGQGIPRLQELAYLETVAKAVAAESPFEGVRMSMVDHIWGNLEAGVGDPPDPASYGRWRSDEKKFVRNVTDSLKELMRLGFVEPATLPSSGTSAYAHKDATYSLTPQGKQWVETLSTDRRRAYDNLIPALLINHPGLMCFLTSLGALSNLEDRDTFVIPLLRWSELPRSSRTHEAYRSAIGSYVAGSLASADLGWTADAAEIGASVNDYLDRVLARAQARDRDPFPTTRTFTQTCEEALVKLAFGKAGCPIDYVSVEIARRWSRWLGLASFTYQAPGPYALRFWSTSRITVTASGTTIGATIDRRSGNAWRERVLDTVYEHCQQARAAGTTYLPVWEVRAAVCWKLRVVDDEFDRAVTDMIAGRRGQDRPWRVHLDQVSLGPAPTSSNPFVLAGGPAGKRTYNAMTVVPRTTH